jgi:hypothetical protein
MEQVDGKQLLSQLPEDLRAVLQDDPGLIDRELETRLKDFPSKNFVPNIGQERAMLPLKQKHEDYGDFPQGTLVTGGNGSGKTGLMAIVLAGCTLGPEFLHPVWLGQHRFFHEWRELRMKRKTYIRIVCDGADVTESGSVYQQVMKWIPRAQFSNKSGGYYTRLHIPNPDPTIYKPVVIDIKTHKQEVTAHAGPDIDLELFNEPCPEGIWTENMGRLRMGGRWMSFLTPLHMASYLYDVINGDSPPGEIEHTEISIWENCADEPHTRGILARSVIEKMIRRWREINPLEVAAREKGQFVFLAGAVFTIFNRRDHVIPPGPIEKSWQYAHGMDPHPVKPHVSVWIARDSMGYKRIIAEYPTEPWEQITSTPFTLRMFGNEIRRIESGHHEKFLFGRPIEVGDNRVGDPKGMGAQNPRTRQRLQSEYIEECDLHFNTNVSNDVMLRHNAIREGLIYNPQAQISAINSPHLFVYSWCHNVISAFERFRYRDRSKQGVSGGLSDKVEDTWECWIAAIGFALLYLHNEGFTPGGDGRKDDYEEYLEGMRIRNARGGVVDERVICHY